MKLKDKIFNLIRSLNDQEIRYLKSNHSTHEIYLKWFDDFKKGNQKKMAFTSKQLHLFYKWLLEKLYFYHSGKFFLAEQLRNITILIEKKLYDQAFELIGKYKKIFIKSESYFQILRLYEKELQIHLIKDNKNFQRVFFEMKSFVKKYYDQYTIYILFQEILYKRKICLFIRKQQEFNQIHEIINRINKVAGYYPKLYSFTYYKTLSTSFFHVMVNEYGVSDRILKKFLSWNRNHSNKYFSKEYFSILVHANIVSIIRNDTASMRKIEKMINKALIPHDRMEREYYYYYFNLLKCNHTRILENYTVETDRLITDSQFFLEEYSKNLDHHKKIMFLYELMKTYFILKKYSNVMNCSNTILTIISNRNIYFDLNTHARILQILSLYQLRQFDILTYGINALKMFMKNHKINWYPEKVIVNAMSKYLLKRKWNDFILNINSEFKRINQPWDKNVFQYFNYLSLPEN